MGRIHELTVNRASCDSISLWRTPMTAALSSARAELSTANSLSEVFVLCKRLGPKMVAKFRDVILLPGTCRRKTTRPLFNKAAENTHLH